jgi:hypothetical protein
MISPSLALFPCAYDAGKLYSVLPDTGAGDFTVSRNGTATYFDKDGLLKTAAADEPRFEFDPLTGDFKGVLVEREGTNIVTNNNTSLSIGAGYITNTILNNEFGPSINGFYLEHGSGGNVNLSGFRIGNSFDSTNNTSVNIGLIIKNPSSNILRVGAVGLSVGNWINFSNLTVDDSNIGKVIKIGTDSYFVILANSYTDGSTASTFRTGLVGSFGSATPVAGNFIIGGLTILLSNTAFSLDKINPIITTGSQVTRPADVIDVTVPSGVTEIKETVNGVENTITSIPTTYQLPNGQVSKVIMT